MAPAEMLLGTGATSALVGQASWFQHQQPLQPLQQLQQQLSQLVSEQPAPACPSAMSSLALTLALCDVHAASQLAATGLPPAGSLQACAAVDGGCGPSVGGYSAPFVFTGAVPVQMPVQIHAPAPAVPLAPPPPPPAAHSLPPMHCSLSAAMLDGNGMLVSTSNAHASAVNVAGLPSVFDALSAAAAAVGQMPVAVQLGQPQPHTLPTGVAAAAPPPVSQLQTPCLSYLSSEPLRCAAPGADPRARAQTRPQLPLQLRMRHSIPRRVRPPSPSPPSLPLTPPQPGSLGSEDWILHVVKVLGMSEPDTARLALHCWRRVSGLPQLHHAARLWSSTTAGRNLYATACLWVSIKLEEKRRAAPGGVVLAHLAATTPAALCSAELAVMNWLEWRPYDGYRLDESHLLVYM